jgi:hypothetical protein
MPAVWRLLQYGRGLADDDAAAREILNDWRSACAASGDPHLACNFYMAFAVLMVNGRRRRTAPIRAAVDQPALSQLAEHVRGSQPAQQCTIRPRLPSRSDNDGLRSSCAGQRHDHHRPARRPPSAAAIWAALTTGSPAHRRGSRKFDEPATPRHPGSGIGPDACPSGRKVGHRRSRAIFAQCGAELDTFRRGHPHRCTRPPDTL